MQKPTSKLSAVVNAKCPRCRRGKIFSGPMYGFKLQHTNEFCPHCGFRFEIEPGYFYAAMYVSYALNVAEMINVGILTFLIVDNLDFDYLWLYMVTILGSCLVFAPFNFRYSRVVLLHWLSPNIHYNPAYDKE